MVGDVDDSKNKKNENTNSIMTNMTIIMPAQGIVTRRAETPPRRGRRF